MVKELIFIKMAQSTMGNGNRINKMGLVLKNGLTTPNLKDTIKMAINMGRDTIFGLMVLNMTEIGETI
jgi:hypothetical protein